jgi:predicted anti-sigma-YlaC factor YlaD
MHGGIRVTCRELIESIAIWMDGDADAATRERVEGHLVQCRSCRDYLHSYRETVRVARAALLY